VAIHWLPPFLYLYEVAVMIFALASQIDPHTRRLIQRVEDFNNTLTEFEKRMEVMLCALEREMEKPTKPPRPSS
jgi:hypothetical protein